MWQPVAREWMAGLVAISAIALILTHWLGGQTDRITARASGWIQTPSRRDFALGLGLVVCAGCAFLSWYCFANQASTGDEMSMRFEARLLASGHLSALPEAHREFFSTPEALDSNGRWFSQFPVGWPLLLAPAMAVHLEWLASPVCAGIAALCFYLFLARVTTEATARFGSILYALSPWMLFLGASRGKPHRRRRLRDDRAGVFARVERRNTPGRRQQPRGDHRLRGRGSGDDPAIRRGATRPRDRHRAAEHGHIARALALVCCAGRGGHGSRRAPLLCEHADHRSPTALRLRRAQRPVASPGFPHEPARLCAHPADWSHSAVDGNAPGEQRGVRVAGFRALVIVALGMLGVRKANRWDALFAGWFTAIALGYLAYWADSYFALGPRFYILILPAIVWFAVRMPGEIGARFQSPKVGRFLRVIIPLSTLAAWRPPLRDPGPSRGCYSAPSKFGPRTRSSSLMSKG